MPNFELQGLQSGEGCSATGGNQQTQRGSGHLRHGSAVAIAGLTLAVCTLAAGGQQLSHRPLQPAQTAPVQTAPAQAPVSGRVLPDNEGGSAAKTALAPAVPAHDRQTLPVGTPLWIVLDETSPMRVGAAIEGRLSVDAYSVDHILLPVGTLVTGHIAALPAVSKGVHREALLDGDFTQLKQPELVMDAVTLPDGRRIPIAASAKVRDVALIAMRAPSLKKPSLFSRARHMADCRIHEEASMVTAPRKEERFERFAYGQLPWHPQKVWYGTQYVAELTSAVEIPAAADPATDGDPPAGSGAGSGSGAAAVMAPAKGSDGAAGGGCGGSMQPAVPPPAIVSDAPDTPVPPTRLSPAELRRLLPTVHFEARLTEDVSSAKAKQGDPVVAVLSRPVLIPAGDGRAGKQLVFPEGTRLTGTVLKATPARSWGRNGALRFTFHSIEEPAAAPIEVQGQLAAVDGQQGQNLSVDSEGGTRAHPDKNRFLGPLTLALMANGAADSDHVAAHSSVAGNGFGLPARLIVVAIANPAVTVGLAAFDFSKSIYHHFIAHGHNVVFPRDTRMVIDMAQH